MENCPSQSILGTDFQSRFPTTNVGWKSQTVSFVSHTVPMKDHLYQPPNTRRETIVLATTTISPKTVKIMENFSYHIPIVVQLYSNPIT